LRECLQERILQTGCDDGEVLDFDRSLLSVS